MGSTKATAKLAVGGNGEVRMWNIDESGASWTPANESQWLLYEGGMKSGCSIYCVNGAAYKAGWARWAWSDMMKDTANFESLVRFEI